MPLAASAPFPLRPFVTINGKPIRLFASGGPIEWPFAAIADLVVALRYPPGALPVTIQILATTNAHELLVIDTLAERLTVAGHYLAGDLIRESIALGNTPPTALDDFNASAVDFIIATCCLDKPYEEGKAILQAARDNSLARATMSRPVAN